MADPIYFAPIRTRVVDPANGLMSREWYLFFQALWLRVGGADAPSSDDLTQAPAYAGLNVADIQATLQTGIEDNAQEPTTAELAAQIAELRKEIDGLKQGVVI